LTGLIPLISNEIGVAITHDQKTVYPIYIGALTLPVSYYIFMKFIQVLQPRAIELIRKDEITASSELRKAVTQVIGNEFSHTISHRWAIYIHGKILTRIAATSLKLESASNANDEKVFSETISALLELLESPDVNFEQSPNDLKTEIHSRLDPWFGLLDINLEIEERLTSMRNSRVQDLGEVIEELVSNSIRHGKAQKISLRVSRGGENEIHINAIDDAANPPSKFQGRFGLGTRIFNLASDGRWDLVRIGSTTEFNLIMTMES
jgi:signal transduction histidine kinase